jgi:ArsR family transcriptional regulator
MARDRFVEIFKALADATRQEILEMLLAQDEMNVTEICSMLREITQPTISHHLQILRQCDLVDTRREGKLIYYSVNKKILHDGAIKFFSRFKIELEG